MELTVIASSNCDDGDCPTIYVDSEGNVGVKGYVDPRHPVEERISWMSAESWHHLLAQLRP